MASRSESGSLAPIDIYSSVINSWTQVFSPVDVSNSKEIKAVEENQETKEVEESLDNTAVEESRESCVCQRLKKIVTLLDIKRAAMSDCEHCRILFNSIEYCLAADPEDINHESWLNTIFIQQTERTRLVEVTCKEPTTSKFSLEIFTNEGVYVGCDAIGTAGLVTQPLSTEFFDKIQEWARECNDEHVICYQKKSFVRDYPLHLPKAHERNFQRLYHLLPPLPRRVLDVGRDHSDPIRLHETDMELAEYTTLSHCWGELKHLTLTKSTWECRKAGIEWSALSKTFQDAIAITRGLRIQYIWIDSLCIIQDDKADWEAESAKMASIYENSWLTIAATTAPNGAYGCFSVPSSEARLRNSKQVRERTNNQQAVYARKMPDKGHEEPDEIAIGFSQSKPLMSRGWCFQERILSRRVLHLCDEEMFWECSINIKCECMRTESPFCSFKNMLDRVLSNEARDNVIVETWDGILSRYIIRGLTFQEDRLQAIIGVSERFRQRRSGLGNCVAGHWEGFLLASLLWFVSKDGIFFPECRVATLPSWSWASLNGRWTYVRAPVESRFPAKVLSTSWRSRAGSETSSGCLWIRLQGRFRSAKLEYTRSHVGDGSVRPFPAQNPRLVDIDTGICFSEAWVDTILASSSRPFTSGTHVYLLEIQEEDIMDMRGSRGLILILAREEKSEDSYERLGLYNADVKYFKDCETRQVTLL